MFVTQCIITDFSASALYKQTNKYKNLGCRRVTSRAMQRKNEEKKNNLPEQKLSHCFRRGTSPSWIRICLYVMYRLRHILGLSQEPLLALNRLENQQNAKLYKHTKPSEKKKMAWKTKIFLLIFPCIIAKMMMMMSIIMMIIIIMQRYSFSCHSTGICVFSHCPALMRDHHIAAEIYLLYRPMRSYLAHTYILSHLQSHTTPQIHKVLLMLFQCRPGIIFLLFDFGCR